MGFADATQFWNERFDKEEFIFGKNPNEVKKMVDKFKASFNNYSYTDGT